MGARGAWWRWLRAPWREPALVVALVGAAAAPVMLVGSADVWRSASQDDVARRAVADEPLDDNGIDVTLEAAFAPASADRADVAMADAVARVGPLEPPTRTIYTLASLITIGPPPIRQVGPAGQLLARDGALDAVRVVDELEDTTDGVWVTTWFADRHDISVGDHVAFEAGAIADEAWNDVVQGGGANSAFRVVGLYEPLWDTDPDQLDPFWNRVPAELIPRFVTAFNAPNFELVLTEEATALASSLTGVLRWQAAATALPTDFDGVVERERRYRNFELELVGSGELAAAMAGASTDADRRPILATDYFETSATVRRAARRLDSPLAAAQGVGGAVGIVAVLAVGMFFVERRRSEFRLLASEGEGAVRMGRRVAAQLLAPFAAGFGAGLLGAVAGPRWHGPADRFAFDELPWTAMSITALVSLVLASTVAGVIGARTLRRHDRRVAQSVGRVIGIALAVATVGAWVQVGRTVSTDETDLDLIVVALPVLVIVMVVGVLLVGIGRLLRLSTRRADRLPVELFLVVRRLAKGSTGVRLAAGALGVGIGLIVFAAALTSTLDRTVDIKLATEIGGASAASVTDDLPASFDVPATTMVRYFDTTLTPGDVPTRIIAIDSNTYSDAMTWTKRFGIEPDAIVAALSASTDESIPAIAVTGEPSPPIGAFGITRAFRYRVVDAVHAFPLVGDRMSTLLVSASAVDEFAFGSAGYSTRDEAIAAGFPLPVDAFRRLVVSQVDPDTLAAALDDAEVRVREITSQRERRGDPAIVATRAAFSYLGVIGVVALAAALVALTLFLSARRRLRALTRVITGSMGLSPNRSALVSVIELAVVLAVSVAAAFVAVPLVVRRLSDRFDPAPQRPPDVPVSVAWVELIVIAGVSVLLICALVWATERRAARRPAGEVLRDAG